MWETVIAAVIVVAAACYTVLRFVQNARGGGGCEGCSGCDVARRLEGRSGSVTETDRDDAEEDQPASLS